MEKLSIPLFEDILNQEIEPTYDTKKEDSLFLLEKLSDKNIQLLKSSGVLTDEEHLYEFKEIFKIFDGNSEFFTAVLAGLISPLAKSIGVVKGSILWYMLTYGIAVAFQELGKDIIDPNKEMDFCKAFSKGAARSADYWAVDSVLTKLFGFVGIDFTTRSIKRVLIHGVKAYILKEDTFYNTIHSVLCGKTFDGNKSIWDLSIGAFSEQIEKIYKSF